MARQTGPKNKKSRRAGIDLDLKSNPAKVQRRLNIPPGQHGRKRRRKSSDYGIQLAEKQKLKWMFGIYERQIRKYFAQAAKTKKATGEILIQLLERRLDNVIYRLKLAPTRAAARQLITHGHARVNNKKINIPSYQVNIEETITLSPKAINFAPTKKILKLKNTTTPKWLVRKAAVGKIKRLPLRDDFDADINEQLIVEFYSR